VVLLSLLVAHIVEFRRLHEPEHSISLLKLMESPRGRTAAIFGALFMGVSYSYISKSVVPSWQTYRIEINDGDGLVDDVLVEC
jgi:hypothetical protein